jgi:hypothetical protein
MARNSERGENAIRPWNIASRHPVSSVQTYIAAGWMRADAQEETQEANNERHCCLCNTIRNCNDTRFEPAHKRSVGLCFRSLSLMPAQFLKRRGHEWLSQFEGSMRIS